MQYRAQTLALAIKDHLDLEIFATNVESQCRRPKFPAMFALDTPRSLGICTILDKNDTKRTAGSFIYLRLEQKDWSVC
jgi:hypothetical protein